MPPRASSRELKQAVERWNALVEKEREEGEGGDQEKKSSDFVEEMLVSAEDIEEDAFLTNMAFGTAGLRAKEGVGFNRMNQVTVALTSQGIADYIHVEQTKTSDGGGGGGGGGGSVAIGFDGRKGSMDFALSAAVSFASKGIRVLLFDDLVPTPLLAFITRERECRAGIMVTASHNPKEYNGYKVYWNNGCQIIPPIDKHIADCIANQVELSTQPSDWTEAQITASELVEVVSAKDECDKYCKGVACAFGRSGQLPAKDSCSDGASVKVVYTPLHGVGSPYVTRMFEYFGLEPFVVVPSQDKPDADFPTVSFPNPEEGAGVWSEAFKVADENGVNVCLANDPDADRFCCAEREEEAEGGSSSWRVFSGNELGLMLGHWIYTSWKEKNQKQGGSDKKIAMLASTVSARVLQCMCQQEGVHFEETLTGFKWLGNRALQLEDEEYEVLFAYEEAIGFMLGGTGVVDKDGVAAAAVFVDLLNHVHGQKRTLKEHLEGLYKKYGERLFKQGYFVIDASINVDEVFRGLRKEYPTEIGGIEVKSVRDMGTGVDTAEDSKKTKLPWSEGDKMITFRFLDNGFCTIRASGTEPKLKYYIDLPLKDELGNPLDVQAVEENVANWLSA